MHVEPMAWYIYGHAHLNIKNIIIIILVWKLESSYMNDSFTIGKNILSRIKAGIIIYLEQNMRLICNFAEHSSPQGERDYYSKNLSVLNVSSFSDWNLFKRCKKP